LGKANQKAHESSLKAIFGKILKKLGFVNKPEPVRSQPYADYGKDYMNYLYAKQLQNHLGYYSFNQSFFTNAKNFNYRETSALDPEPLRIIFRVDEIRTLKKPNYMSEFIETAKQCLEELRSIAEEYQGSIPREVNLSLSDLDRITEILERDGSDKLSNDRREKPSIDKGDDPDPNRKPPRNVQRIEDDDQENKNESWSEKFFRTIVAISERIASTAKSIVTHIATAAKAAIAEAWDMFWTEFIRQMILNVPAEPALSPASSYRYQFIVDKFLGNVQGGDIMNGDVFKIRDSQNMTIINKLLVEKSFNRVQEQYDKDTADALLRVANYIEESGNQEAGEIFAEFNEELQKPEPRRVLLRNSWKGIKALLPIVAQATDIGEKISKLFIS
jgi:hypothetical protein